MNLIWVVSAVFVTSFLATALQPESIIGGFPAQRRTFTYTVAIFGTQNYSSHSWLVCTGGIITSDLILTAAHCFVNEIGELKEIRYSARVDTTDLKSSNGLHFEFTHIYAYNNNNILHVHDIAIGQLETTLDLENNNYLSRMIIPTAGQIFNNYVGSVTGYGASVIESGLNVVTGKERRISGSSNFTLKHLYVKVANASQCIQSHPEVDVSKQFCGVAQSLVPGQRAGICIGDYGAPLVVGPIVIGIASRNSPNCDDTVNGCVYTQVSSFIPFINQVMSGLLSEKLAIHHNRIHVNRRF